MEATHTPDGEGRVLARVGRALSAFLRSFRQRVERKPWLNLAYRITLSAIGAVVILAGIAMLVLPGPGWLTIFLGLAILGTEFGWARRILAWLRATVEAYAWRWRAWRAARAERKATERNANA